MFLAIRKYRKVEGDRNQIADTIRTGFVPLISKIDGFIDYYCVYTDDGDLLSVNVYRDKKGAEESVRAAATWVEQNLSKHLPEAPEVIAGDVFAQGHSEKRKAA